MVRLAAVRNLQCSNLARAVFYDHLNAYARLSSAIADRYTIERELGAGGMTGVRDSSHDSAV